MPDGALPALLPLRDWRRLESLGETAVTLLAGM